MLFGASQARFYDFGCRGIWDTLYPIYVVKWNVLPWNEWFYYMNKIKTVSQIPLEPSSWNLAWTFVLYHLQTDIFEKTKMASHFNPDFFWNFKKPFKKNRALNEFFGHPKRKPEEFSYFPSQGCNHLVSAKQEQLLWT